MAATLKSIDYNVAMTFILNNYNNNNSKTRSLPASPLQSIVLLLNYNVLVPTAFVLVGLTKIIIESAGNS